jgi:uncharacterized protein (TIGR04255 family)
MTEHVLPEYEKPPLSEIAVGVQFELLPGWHSRHVGHFWTEIAEEFPTTQDQPPILNISERGPRLEILLLPPLRRTFLISKDQNYVIQLQDSRFLLNWRKIKETDVYPRFGTVFQEFLSAWGRFSDFVTREKLGSARPNKYELTYVNHIEHADKPLAATVEKHVKLFNWSNLNVEFLAPPTGINTVWTFALPGQLGFGQANLSQGVKSDGRGVLVLVMSCTGDASPKLSLNDWFATTHEWLARGFVELTTDFAHRQWGEKR